MKKVKNIGSVLSKSEQKSVTGGARCGGGDGICCGNANWQCGTGLHAGGLYNPGNGTCDCL